MREVKEVREIIAHGNLVNDNGTLARLDNAEDKLNNFSAETKSERFGGIPDSDVDVYQRVFRVLATHAPSPGSARELIDLVFEEASRVAQNSSGINPDQSPGNRPHVRLEPDNSGALTPK